MKEKAFDLETRLIRFAVSVIRLTEALPQTPVGNHIRNQLLRSGTSPAPNYGEAQSAESRSDFVHKMKVALKELRESRVWLLIIQQAELLPPANDLEVLLQECNELIAIFVASLKTAERGRD